MNENICSFCNKKFLSKASLSTHEKWCDPDNKEWQENILLKLKNKTKVKKKRKRNSHLSEVYLKRYNPNLIQDFFENIDNEKKAYWLGFLYGDGYISKEFRRVVLSVHIKDKQHIELFKKTLNASNHLNEKNNMIRFLVTCEKMVEDLIKWGCIQKKSLELYKMPKINKELIHHFIRGIFDADGTISIKPFQFILTGTLDFLYSINNLLQNNDIIISSNKIYKEKRCERIGYIRYSGINAKSIFEWIYKDATIYLQRKYDLYSHTINSKL